MIFQIVKGDEFKSEFAFQDQLKRATPSISNNIAEGFERNSTKDRIRFLEYSSGSISEVKSMLYSAPHLNLIRQEDFDILVSLCIKCLRQVRGFLKYLHSIK